MNLMRTSIILGKKDIYSELKAENENRNFVNFSTSEEAYFFQLDHPGDIDSYILDYNEFPENQLLKIIRHIRFLNEMVQIVIITGNGFDIDREQFGDNVKICTSGQEISEELKTITGEARQYSRVKWPVAVVFRESGKPEEKNEGIVISISSGGCLIMSETVPGDGARLMMTIIFKNFDFLVEGVVVRRNGRNFAVKLENISSQTQSLIQEIVNEKILVELKDLD